MATIRDVPDDTELTRRLISLISLLGIYAVGLVLVAFVSDGPDIGVLLAAMFGHAVWVGVRYAVRENRERRTLVSAGSRGLMVLARRARFIRYRDIAAASASSSALTLRVRDPGGAPTEVVLRWSEEPSVRAAFFDRLAVRVRRAAVRGELAMPPRGPLAARSRESLARVAAALGELTSPRSSTHIPLVG